jgi:hypothetical protein
MHIVALAWMFVVLLMAAAEAGSTQGTLLGALFTLLLYGFLPLGIVLYVMGAPARGRARRAAQAREMAAAETPPPSAEQRDGGGHATGSRLPAEREEP